MYYVTSVYCMVQRIYLIRQPQRCYNTLKIKNTRKVQNYTDRWLVASFTFLGGTFLEQPILQEETLRKYFMPL